MAERELPQHKINSHMQPRNTNSSDTGATIRLRKIIQELCPNKGNDSFKLSSADKPCAIYVAKSIMFKVQGPRNKSKTGKNEKTNVVDRDILRGFSILSISKNERGMTIA